MLRLRFAAFFFAGLLACDATAAFAQAYFFNKLELPTGKSPQGLAVGDFNGDGMPDFAVANNGDGTVSVFLGKPDGTFTALTPFSTGTATAPVGIVAADFNGDKKLDLAVVLNGANTVAVFAGKGDGTFNAAVSFAVGTGPVAVAAADLNGDKKVDLVVANYTASSVTILLNKGTGAAISFAQASGSPLAVSSNPTSIAVADFNGDSKPDLAVGIYGTYGANNVNIFLGSGTGTFTAGAAMAAGQEVWAVAAGDFDGDGKIDLAVGGLFSVDVYLGNGNGTFGTSPFGVPNNTGAFALMAFDINGDKKLDLITLERDKFLDNTTFTVNLNNTTTKGFPSFTYPGVHFAAGFQPSAMGFADFNHDGRLDAVVTSQATNTVDVFLGNGLGKFDPSVTTAENARQPYNMVMSDFNKDKNIDLAISGYGGNVAVLTGKGNGTFTEADYTIAGNLMGLVAADLNGDGYPDIAVVNKTGNTVSIMLNEKNGKFPATFPTYPTGTTPVSITAGDFRLTGHMDLAIADNGESAISILPNDGTGKFGAATTLPLAANTFPAWIVTGDFNGDKAADLAVANGSMLSIFLNNKGAFGAPATISLTGQPLYVATASVRNNGILDLVAVFNGSLAVLLGKGNGTFAAPVYYTFQTQSGSVAVTVADMNGDGIPDLVVANNGESTVAIMEGRGDGTFLPVIRYEITSPISGGGSATPVIPIAADFNNDGYTDFVSLNNASNYTVYLNTSAAAVWPNSLNLGTRQLGQVSAAKTATLYSSGIVPLTATATVTPADYTATADTCGTAMAKGTSCSVTVTFSPKDINARAGGISFADKALNTPQKTALTGTGTDVGPSPSPVNFGSVVHGSSATQSVTVKNLSGGTFPVHTLTFTSIAVAGTGFSLSTDGCPPSTSSLAAGASCTVTVKFAPATAGTFTGTLTFTDNGGASPQTVSLTGKGT